MNYLLNNYNIVSRLTVTESHLRDWLAAGQRVFRSKFSYSSLGDKTIIHLKTESFRLNDYCVVTETGCHNISKGTPSKLLHTVCFVRVSVSHVSGRQCRWLTAKQMLLPHTGHHRTTLESFCWKTCCTLISHQFEYLGTCTTNWYSCTPKQYCKVYTVLLLD